MLRQELDFFGATKTGDVTSRLSADCQKVADQVQLNVNVFLRSVIQVGVLRTHSESFRSLLIPSGACCVLRIASWLPSDFILLESVRLLLIPPDSSSGRLDESFLTNPS